MRKLIMKLVFLAVVVLVPVSVMAQVQVNINVPLPPPISFAAPPQMIVIPETHVYAVPDVREDIFFFSGWWWRLWEGRWYRSQHYDRGWSHFRGEPGFYRHVPSQWRDDYRDRRWKGHPWDQRMMSHGDVEKNWRSWKDNKHWEKENHWGVKELDRRPPGQEKKMQQRTDGGPQREGIRPDKPGKGPNHPDKPGQQKKFADRPEGPQPKDDLRQDKAGKGPNPPNRPDQKNKNMDRSDGPSKKDAGPKDKPFKGPGGRDERP